MLQRREMQPDDFVNTLPLDIFTQVSSGFVTHARLIGFCYTCTSYWVLSHMHVSSGFVTHAQLIGFCYTCTSHRVLLHMHVLSGFVTHARLIGFCHTCTSHRVLLHMHVSSGFVTHAHLIGFCYTCTFYRVSLHSRWRKIVNLLVINGKLSNKFASEEFVYSLAPIKLKLHG